MEYHENKDEPSMLLKMAILYIELDSYQGALSICTLILETTRTFSQLNEVIFLSALVAKGLSHSTQSGDYFAYLVDNPPHNLKSYRVLVLAGTVLSIKCMDFLQYLSS